MVKLVGLRLWKIAHVKHFSELESCVFSELKFAAECPSIIFENRSCRQRRKQSQGNLLQV